MDFRSFDNGFKQLNETHFMQEYIFTSRVENSLDSDQKVADLDLQCVKKKKRKLQHLNHSLVCYSIFDVFQVESSGEKLRLTLNEGSVKSENQQYSGSASS